MRFSQFGQKYNFPIYVSEILNGIQKCEYGEIKI